MKGVEYLRTMHNAASKTVTHNNNNNNLELTFDIRTTFDAFKSNKMTWSTVNGFSTGGGNNRKDRVAQRELQKEEFLRKEAEKKLKAHQTKHLFNVGQRVYAEYSGNKH